MAGQAIYRRRPRGPRPPRAPAAPAAAENGEDEPSEQRERREHEDESEGPRARRPRISRRGRTASSAESSTSGRRPSRSCAWRSRQDGPLRLRLVAERVVGPGAPVGARAEPFHCCPGRPSRPAAPNWPRRERRPAALPPAVASCQAARGQVGEERAQVPARLGGEGLIQPLVELVLGQPSAGEVLTHLAAAASRSASPTRISYPEVTASPSQRR